MTIRKCLLFSILFLTGLGAFAQSQEDGIGQTIQITTQLHSFVGNPSWLLIIRDLDNDENIPYLYDFRKGDNYWLALTYGHHYLITVSSMKFDPYARKINNFCHLESNGRIARGESLYITINGDLSPNTNTFTCHVLRYVDPNFTITNQDSSN